MKKYYIYAYVEQATGIQTFSVYAENKEEALKMYDEGEVTFVSEEIEVQSIGNVEIYEATR